MRASRGYGYARAGRDEAAKTVLEQLAPTPRDTDIGATHIARIYAGLGEFDRAFEFDRAPIANRSEPPFPPVAANLRPRQPRRAAVSLSGS